MKTSRFNLPALAVLMFLVVLAIAWLAPVPDLGATVQGVLRHLVDAPAGGVSFAMATLVANKPRAFEQGAMNDLQVAASTRIFEGAAVGLNTATGLARPILPADRFVGFAEATADNLAGAAAAIRVRVYDRGEVLLPVTGALITDVGNPVYAIDDDLFSLSPVGGAFVGFIKRWVSNGLAVVQFDATAFRDPYAARTVREVISTNKTLTAADTGKLFWVDTDALIITLPAVAAGVFGVQIVNGGGFGAVAVNVSPDVNDSILGPNITAADNKDLINTKATARRGDYVVLDSGDADGYLAVELRGTWAREA